MSNFDYGYTCPDINKEISNFKSALSDRLDEIIEELCPIITATDTGRIWRTNWEQTIYNDAESCFENVRDCNSNIRDEAERQINAVADERDEYRKLYEEAEDRIRELEDEVKELQETVDNFEYN